MKKQIVVFVYTKYFLSNYIEKKNLVITKFECYKWSK